jgi:hypothetical protein
MAQRPSLDDYVDVAERIQDFKDAHPDGTLQTLAWGIEKVGDQYYVYYQAAAYRTADDLTPGQGIAWEPWPGKTPYTRDSELMNAETAAWGRAIVACGLVANRKLASRQEVRNRIADQEAVAEPSAKVTPIKAQGPARKTLTDNQVISLEKKLAEKDADPSTVQVYLNSLGVSDLPELTTAQANALVKRVAA